MITIETKVSKQRPINKITSAIFSKTSDLLFALIEVYEKTLDMRNSIIKKPTVSSMIVSFDIFESLINVSITKHNPNRFEDVGKICLDIFLLFSFSIMLNLFA
jgi:hypothetical protein